MQTEAERQERRKAYQREYYKERRKGERALNYVINIEASQRRREAQKQAEIKRRKKRDIISRLFRVVFDVFSEGYKTCKGCNKRSYAADIHA